jgi:hypothetical protein
MAMGISGIARRSLVIPSIVIPSLVEIGRDIFCYMCKLTVGKSIKLGAPIAGKICHFHYFCWNFDLKHVYV